MPTNPSSKVTLFGVAVDNLTIAETLDRIEHLIRDGGVHQHVVLNVDKIVRLDRDPELRAAVVGCDLINADGQPVVWLSRLVGRPLKERVAGIDLFEQLMARCAARGLRPFLLGASEPVVAQVVAVLQNRHTGLQLAGWRSGYWATAEEPAVIAQIKNARPDVLCVALGSPRQELFLRRWKQELQAPFLMGVGGSFDVVAGIKRRAPLWMQRGGLEWFYRLAQEPRRLWRRYLVDDWQFLPLAWREWRQR
jgi:N-acetylglucosaminyldiphosphoundecaprenol N-acetyl-beta-D-mannosaminyltransferase